MGMISFRSVIRRTYVGGILLALSARGITITAQTASDSILPPEAVVIERAAIPQTIHKDRELVLWMLSPQKHDRGEFSKSNPYMCPEMTLGSYFSGPTRVSLVDTNSKKSINTVTIRHNFGAEDSFDIPYRILADYEYLVPGHPHGSEGKPALLALRDLNGDGLPLETAFYEAEACMGLQTTLVGYSPKQDRVIQYEVELTLTEQKMVEGRGIANKEKPTTIGTKWVDYLFAESPTRPGRWSYQIDYRGRLGTLDSYDVHYDPSREKFFGTRVSLPPPPDPQ
jgi:hypothetical protein